MRFAVVEVIPLIGEDDAVLLGLLQFFGQPAADMLIVIGIGIRKCRHFNEFGAGQP